MAVEVAGKRLLIDTSPDMREQVLREGIATVDAILYTHAHADHAHGIDDTRGFCVHGGHPIDVYGDNGCLSELKAKFGYAFEPPIKKLGWFRPALIPHVVTPLEKFTAAGVEVLPFAQDHGPAGTTLGFRIGNFAYSTDVNSFPPESMECLRRLDVWVVDCVQYKPHPTHAHVEKVINWARMLKPRRTILTHLSHHFDHEKLAAELPQGLEPAFDGLKVDVA